MSSPRRRRGCSVPVFSIVAASLLILGQPALAQAGAAPLTVSLPGLAATVDAAEAISEVGAGEGDSDQGHAEPGKDHGGNSSSRLSAEDIPLQLEGFPKRPKPILELGPNFLGTGHLGDGFKLPTGAIWQPAFLVFGQLRVAAQTSDNGVDSVSEVAGRLDLFANLALSGSERIVVGLRNLDENGSFTSYIFESDRPGVEEGSQDALNSRISTLFFEGDFGEIFQNFSKRDFSSTDWGFSVGRQPLLFQDGLLISDFVDGIGITRNTLQPNGTSNFRFTLFYAWDNIHRTAMLDSRANLEDESGNLFAFLTSTDFRWSTMDIDAAYVTSTEGDHVAVGISAVQRIGQTNSSFRLLGSYADEETPYATTGSLFFTELSRTPHHTHNLLYFNGFWAVDDYRSASRDPSAGGPLTRAGINFASVGLGSVGAPLSSEARDVAGGAIGYQMFFDHTRKQVIAELGVRYGIDEAVNNQAAATVRYQQAMGKHWVAVVDGSVSYREGLEDGGSRTLYGARLELVTKF